MNPLMTDARPTPGWVSLALAPLEQAIEDYQELVRLGIVINGDCIFTETTWPRSRNGRKTEFIAGSFGRLMDVLELIHFLNSKSVDAIINATGIPLNAKAMRDKLGINKHGRRDYADERAKWMERRAREGASMLGSQDLCSTLPGVPTGLTCQEQPSPAEFTPAPKSQCIATPAVPESTTSASATAEYLSGAPAAADPCSEASAVPNPTPTPTPEEPGTK